MRRDGLLNPTRFDLGPSNEPEAPLGLLPFRPIAVRDRLGFEQRDVGANQLHLNGIERLRALVLPPDRPAFALMIPTQAWTGSAHSALWSVSLHP
jgi:hypothetical protein